MNASEKYPPYRPHENLIQTEVAKLNIPVCPGCGHEIDPEICWCGDYMEHHTQEHLAVPMGCTCGYADNQSRKSTNREIL